MTALAPAILGRLARVCGLLGSDHIGERAAAAAQADRIVRAAGLTWPDILSPPNTSTAKVRKRHRAGPTPGEILARHGERLTGWERGFLTSLIRQPMWSPRQFEVFESICERVVGAAR
jgi:hypothetical protein